MGEDLLHRVRKSSAAVAVLVTLIGLVARGPQWSLAFALAAAWSIANLWVLERLLTLLIRRGSRLALLVVFCLKVPILYGLMLLYLIAIPWRPSALLGGISLPYAVIVLKAVGHVLIEATARKGSPTQSGNG